MLTNPVHTEVKNLREQGLTDGLIQDELTRKGHPEEQVFAALSGQEIPVPIPGGGTAMPEMPEESGYSIPMPDSEASSEGNVYERIEEMTESMIDEKWDELIAEVKKIVEWKEKVEEKQSVMMSDIKKIKEDFAVLHQGVLGKLDAYDNRMKDVGTELGAVSKVFKEVIPEFVENVKELRHLSHKAKK
jgi:hypothetical protein